MRGRIPEDFKSVVMSFVKADWAFTAAAWEEAVALFTLIAVYVREIGCVSMYGYKARGVTDTCKTFESVASRALTREIFSA